MGFETLICCAVTLPGAKGCFDSPLSAFHRQTEDRYGEGVHAKISFYRWLRYAARLSGPPPCDSTRGSVVSHTNLARRGSRCIATTSSGARCHNCGICFHKDEPLRETHITRSEAPCLTCHLRSTSQDNDLICRSGCRPG
jgi:hypothetical protein